MYVGTGCQCLTRALGKGEQGLPGQALIRAFQREPSLLSLIPDRLLVEGYEMKLEGKYCTTGRPWLSWQLRPPQGVNYTQRQPGILENAFWACPKKAQRSPAAHLLRSLGTRLPRGSDGQCSSAAQRADLAPGAVCLPEPDTLCLHTIPSWVLQQRGPLPTSPGHLALVLLFPVACPPLPIHRPWGTIWHQLPSSAPSVLNVLQMVIFSNEIKFRGRNKLTRIDE